MLDHGQQTLLGRERLLIPGNDSRSFHEDIFHTVNHDFRDCLILEQLRKNIEPAQAVKQFHPQSNLLFERHIHFPRLLHDALVNNPANLRILHITRQVYPCHYIHLQFFTQRL